MVGVNARGEKKFLAIEDGVRESTQSWRVVLLALKNRGLSIPKLAIGDGAMGFWAALEEVFPTTRQQRCCPLGRFLSEIACRVIDAQNWQCDQLLAQALTA